MRYKILRDIDSLIQVKEAWNDIIDENDCFEVFQSPEWVISWYSHFCSNNSMFCLVFYDDSKKVMSVVPLVINDNDASLYFAGTPLNDCNNFVVRYGHSIPDIVLKAFDIVKDTCKVTEHFVIDCIDSSVKCLSDVNFKSDKKRVFLEDDDISVYLKLPEKYSEYTNKISSKKLKRFTYYERKLFKQKSVGFSKLNLESNLDEFMNWFKKNKITNWKCSGQYDQILDQLKEDNFYNFLKMVVKGLLKKQQVVVSYIKIENKIVVGGIYFTFHKRMMKYMQSWDYKFKTYNPGTVLDWIMIKSAIADGFTVFDFGRGDENYKYDFGGENRHLLKLVINRE